MTVNGYVKNWCDEEYDVRKEDFFVENAYYTADREWAISGFKHGLFALAIGVVTILLGNGGLFINLVSAFANIGILTVCFWFYAIRNYDANSMETSVGFYIMLAVLLFLTKNRIGPILQLLLSIPLMALYAYFTFIKPLKFVKTAKRMKKLVEEMEEEEDRRAKQNYTQWEGGYKAFRYGLPESEQTAEKGDPDMIKARTLFDGYCNDKQMLKTRYRQLAKQYHPDKGGDTKLFQCIIAVYEEIGKTFI